MLVSARASLEEVWEVVTRHSGPSDVMLSSCCRDQDLDLIPTTVIEKQTPGHTSDKVRTPPTLLIVFSWRIMNPSPATGPGPSRDVSAACAALLGQCLKVWSGDGGGN